MKRCLAYLVIVLLSASQAWACMWGQPQRAGLYEVFNGYFYESASSAAYGSGIGRLISSYLGQAQRTGLYEVFNGYFYESGSSAAYGSDIELLMSPYIMDNGSQDAWWGAPGDLFTVEAVYSSSWNGVDLGYMENGVTHELVHSRRSRQLRPGADVDAAFTVESGNGFMWVGSSAWWGVDRYSDPSENWGDRDMFLAFAITDSDMLAYFYGDNPPDPDDELYLIAFDGLNSSRGDFTDLVAVVRRTPMETNAVPLPASALLLASGGLLAAVCRWNSKLLE